jgi:hypothetical protein
MEKFNIAEVALRDYFAAIAVAGKTVGFAEIHPDYWKKQAEQAYLLADAMMAERSKNEPA